MTLDEFKTWGASKFYANGQRKITYAEALQLVYNIADTFAHIDSPFPKYTGTISQAQLDDDNEIIIEHGLSTNVPYVLVKNELNQPISTAFFSLTPVDGDNNSATFKFYGDIPETGTGVYTYVIIKVVDTIAIPRIPAETEYFTDDFTEWEAANAHGEKPVNWTANDSEFSDTMYLENVDDAMRIYYDDYQRIILQALNFLAVAGITYQVTVDITDGVGLVIKIGNTRRVMLESGTFTVTPSTGGSLILESLNESGVADTTVNSIIVTPVT